MNVYFDTSALIPLLVAEPTSGSFKDLWRHAEKVTSTRLLFVEASSTLERIERSGRISNSAASTTIERLSHIWEEVVVIELGEGLMLEAAMLARSFGLRGFDAVHCAAAFGMDDDNVIAASSDSRLNAAWSKLGMTVFNPHA